MDAKMSSTAAASPIHAPVYAAAAVSGLLASGLTKLLHGGACAATMPALTAAGLVWQTKSFITKERSSLAEQPSILNWHDLVSQE